MSEFLSPGLLMILVAVVAAMLLLRPRVFRAPIWRAMVTPFASIIGSGFLVAAPILAHVAGNFAWLAMLALCATGYMFGAAIRHNILHVEPLIAGELPISFRALEQFSNLALAFAYFVSVAYYLNLFAAFALRADDIVDPEMIRWLSSGVIVTLGLVGALRGLQALENLEVVAVGIKLALIAGLLAALSLAGALALSNAPLVLANIEPSTSPKGVGTLLGLLILVQGFETSRYLGAAYDGPTRVRTMKYAQWLATCIYIVFIFLVTPFFTGNLPAEGGETEIITMLTTLGTVVGPLIIFAALASQLSAAIADMNGAGGLLNSVNARLVPVRIGYLLTAVAALAITWTASILEIIAYASKAFVLYYGLQSALALLETFRSKREKYALKSAFFGSLCLLSLAVLFFAIPAQV